MRKQFLLISLLVISTYCVQGQDKARVFVFTDINIDSGDPDDRQSLVHLLWYANELEIEGIIPERWNARGFEACRLVLDAYEEDYKKQLSAAGYPEPEELNKSLAANWEQGKAMFHDAAAKDSSPLYVLIWGNMEGFKDALLEKPELFENIRVITIGTGLMLERNIPFLPQDWEVSPPCKQMNWNAKGRNDIYTDARFDDMWWLELNWTYEGMFTGPEPADMLVKLSGYGAMGQHLRDVVKNEEWARYFRVGDTPSVLYMIDPEHDKDDPTTSSWAGKFVKPFPGLRPNYSTDYSGTLNWDYSDPCKTWSIHEQVKDLAAGSLEERRSEMYDALLKKLTDVYGITGEWLMYKAIQDGSENFDWLLGDWQRNDEAEGKETFENWRKVSNSEYSGFGFTKQAGDTIWQEKMSLIFAGGNWDLSVKMPGGSDSVSFRMSSFKEKEFVCSNEKHDFPKKIKYWKEANKLKALVSGDELEIQFEFEKIE